MPENDMEMTVKKKLHQLTLIVLLSPVHNANFKLINCHRCPIFHIAPQYPLW